MGIPQYQATMANTHYMVVIQVIPEVCTFLSIRVSLKMRNVYKK